ESLVIDDGATLRADALVSGNGGQVILWSDATTTFRGDISAQALGNTGDGGFVEVSGKQTLLYDGTVSTFAANGQSGTLLLDPTNFTITASGDPPSSNSIGNTTLAVMLAGGNVVITTASAGADAGDITVNAGANVNWNSANSLSLLAHRHIVVGANIQNQGTGGVHLIAGWNGTGLSSAPGDSGVTPSTFNLSHFQSTPAAYGNNGGIVHIGGGTQAAGVAVGSRDGLTYAAGHGIELRGGNGTGNRYAHLGHHATADGDSAHGHILVEAKEGGVAARGKRFGLLRPDWAWRLGPAEGLCGQCDRPGRPWRSGWRCQGPCGDSRFLRAHWSRKPGYQSRS
ncbi:MAG TPA: hypothetical protein PLA50_05680, partial [Bacteroidia bacterium]|nr:hypothetical protein [Bacteroidia bacterium]